jgi:hypothetical protein
VSPDNRLKVQIRTPGGLSQLLRPLITGNWSHIGQLHTIDLQTDKSYLVNDVYMGKDFDFYLQPVHVLWLSPDPIFVCFYEANPGGQTRVEVYLHQVNPPFARRWELPQRYRGKQMTIRVIATLLEKALKRDLLSSAPFTRSKARDVVKILDKNYKYRRLKDWTLLIKEP